MNSLEVTKLRAVLGQRFQYSADSPDGPVIYDTATESTTTLRDCRTAAEAISNLVHDARAMGRLEGKSELQVQYQRLMGIVVMGDHAPTRTGLCATGYGLDWFSGRKSAEYLAGKFNVPRGFRLDLAVEHLRDLLTSDHPDREEVEALLQDLISHYAGEHQFYDRLREWNEDEWYLRAQGFDREVMAKLAAIQHRFAVLIGDLDKEVVKEKPTEA